MTYTTCTNCIFWDSADLMRGKCRVKSPVANLVPTQGIGGQSLAVISYWPETQADDWCGQYKRDEERSEHQGTLKLT